MILYSMLLSSNRLTPEEGILLTPFFKKNDRKKIKKSAVKLLPEVEEENVPIPGILKFQISKKSTICYRTDQKN